MRIISQDRSVDPLWLRNEMVVDHKVRHLISNFTD